MPRARDQGASIGPRPDRARLSPNVARLGVVSLLMGMSSAMIYRLLPLFLVTIVGAGVASVGVIEACLRRRSPTPRPRGCAAPVQWPSAAPSTIIRCRSAPLPSPEDVHANPHSRR